VIVIRLLVGAVFLPEGIQKFSFLTRWVSDASLRIGIPSLEITAPFVGTIEIVGGALRRGFATRLAAIPLLVSMIVAITTNEAHFAAIARAHFRISVDVLIIALGIFMLTRALSSR
jgi:uncharacterized membrane protein YphA (DoxX/SURF4 family)